MLKSLEWRVVVMEEMLWEKLIQRVGLSQHAVTTQLMRGGICYGVQQGLILFRNQARFPLCSLHASSAGDRVRMPLQLFLTTIANTISGLCKEVLSTSTV